MEYWHKQEDPEPQEPNYAWHLVCPLGRWWTVPTTVEPRIYTLLQWNASKAAWTASQLAVLGTWFLPRLRRGNQNCARRVTRLLTSTPSCYCASKKVVAQKRRCVSLLWRQCRCHCEPKGRNERLRYHRPCRQRMRRYLAQNRFFGWNRRLIKSFLFLFFFMSLPVLGAKISLISKSNIRFVGTLHEINHQDSCVSLANGICYLKSIVVWHWREMSWKWNPTPTKYLSFDCFQRLGCKGFESRRKSSDGSLLFYPSFINHNPPSFIIHTILTITTSTIRLIADPGSLLKMWSLKTLFIQPNRALM